MAVPHLLNGVAFDLKDNASTPVCSKQGLSRAGHAVSLQLTSNRPTCTGPHSSWPCFSPPGPRAHMSACAPRFAQMFFPPQQTPIHPSITSSTISSSLKDFWVRVEWRASLLLCPCKPLVQIVLIGAEVCLLSRWGALSSSILGTMVF